MYIWTIVIEGFLFFFMMAFIIWWCSVTLLPIFYGVPKAISLFFKGEMRLSGVFSQLATPFVCNIILFVFIFLLVYFFPNIDEFLFSKPGFHLGQAVGMIIFIVGAIFSESTHEDMRQDFKVDMKKYRK